jgi:hypothetical protein
MTTKTTLPKILKGILHTEDKNKHNHERNHMRKTDKHSESSTELTAYTQILKKTKTTKSQELPHTYQ